MSETPQQAKKNMSPDWFVQGVLTKIGDVFDRLTGRRWKPGSSLATSELIERLKALLDAEAKADEGGRRFVPHNIKLKMQWDKFSTDSEKSLKALENELLTAVVDHINDRHYYTYSPLSIEVKPDYFTEGVKLFAGFEKFTGDDSEREIDVSMPGANADMQAASPSIEEGLQAKKKIRVRFVLDTKPVERILTLKQDERVSIGRTKENHIAIDDQSISKYHAAIVLNSERTVVVADTGSTNGTFVAGERIAHGKAIEIKSGEKLRFGVVDVTVDIAADPGQPRRIEEAKTEVYKVSEFQFAKKTEVLAPAAHADLPKTKASIEVGPNGGRPQKPVSEHLAPTQPAIDPGETE